MSNDELHQSVQNIEQRTHTITNRQLVTIICIVVSAAVSAAAYWFTDKASYIKDNTEVRGMFKDLKNDMMLQLQQQQARDSINFIKLNNKIDMNRQTADGHFLMLEERMKGFVRANLPARQYLTERRVNGKLTLVAAK